MQYTIEELELIEDCIEYLEEKKEEEEVISVVDIGRRVMAVTSIYQVGTAYFSSLKAARAWSRKHGEEVRALNVPVPPDIKNLMIAGRIVAARYNAGEVK